MTQKNPMPLENLPQYLKEQRENGNTGSAPVVGMGQIVPPPAPKPSSGLRWAERFVFAAILLIGIAVGGYATYDIMTPQQFTVIVDVDNGVNAIPTIVSDSGGEVIGVKQNSDSTYEVEVSTYKSKRSFLDWLRSNDKVRRANLEN